MAKFLGIDFVPRNTPVKRKLQMAAVVLHIINFSLSPILACFVLVYLLFTSFWWIALGYITWMLYDIRIKKTSAHGGRRSNWMRNSAFMHYFANYFPISLEKTADLDPSKNYIMGYHPHGILSCGAFCNFGSNGTGFEEIFPGIKSHLLTLETNFRWPILRGYTLWMGICDVSKASIEWILSKQGKGNAAVIVIGGAAESLEAHPGNYNLTLKNRKGFVKIAIRMGASLVPIFSFGENDLFKQANNPRGSYLRIFQEKFKQIMGFSPPLFYGRGIINYTFGLIPYRIPIVSVVGKPIDVPQVENPSSEMITEYHNKYIEELAKLFDAHKEKYGIGKNVKLNFI